VTRGEQGSTLVEFLGSALIIVLALLALAQMAVWIWARGVTANAAHEGARAAASLGASDAAGVWQARGVLQDGLGSTARGFRVDAARRGGVVHVEIEGESPRVVGFMPAFSLHAASTVLDEATVMP
jgi:hypothetical protein